MDCRLPGSSVHGIPQVRILSMLSLPSPGDLPNPWIKPVSPAFQVDSLTLSHLGNPLDYTPVSKKFADALLTNM